MPEIRLGLVESHFADIVWEHAPLTTKELIDLCAKELNWKRTTTYTVLKKLCERGIFATNDSIVTTLIPKDKFHAMQSEQFVKETFHGSLPAFISAFTSLNPPTDQELAEIKKLIDSWGE